MPTYEMTLIPAYGRDYKSAKAARTDWESGKDFRIATIGPDSGAYTSKRDWTGKHVAIRYNKLTQLTIVKG